jgi:hypothetical protein
MGAPGREKASLGRVTEKEREQRCRMHSVERVLLSRSVGSEIVIVWGREREIRGV